MKPIQCLDTTRGGNDESQSETGRYSSATQAPGENGSFGELRTVYVIRSRNWTVSACSAENLENREISVKPWCQGLMYISEESETFRSIVPVLSGSALKTQIYGIEFDTRD